LIRNSRLALPASIKRLSAFRNIKLGNFLRRIPVAEIVRIIRADHDVIDTAEADQVFDRIEAINHVIIVNILQIGARRHLGFGGARSGAHFPAAIKTAEVIGKEAAAVQNTELQIGKTIEYAAVG
jgi:hypothetical protein